MPRVLSDQEICALLNEPKPLPADWRKKLDPRAKKHSFHLQGHLKVDGNEGNRFRIIARSNELLLNDFSVILQFIDEDDTDYTLTRFNGPSHSHTNHWEKRQGKGKVFLKRTPHIHLATERYQLAGFAIDGYAVETDSYTTFDAAIREFAFGHGFSIEGHDPRQQSMFDDQ